MGVPRSLRFLRGAGAAAIHAAGGLTRKVIASLLNSVPALF